MSRAAWQADPVAFITDVLRNPEDKGKPFVLYPAQERFLREALTPGADGRLPYPELVYGCPKKSGKTATAAMIVLYIVLVLGGPFAEGYCLANDFEQSTGRVFQAIARIIKASPLLRDAAKITQNKIEFPATGATITALASDYAGAAGSNPTIVCFDELWGYTQERAHRLWDEMVPVPTRQVSVRLTTTYAGFEGESDVLEALYKRGLQGELIAPSLYRQPGLLMFWSHEPVAPWQTPDWLTQMRTQLRPNAYLRMIENRFVTSETAFVDPIWWAVCEDPAAHPVVLDRNLPVWIGVDASVTRDSTAIVVCSWDEAAKQVRLIGHRIFEPSVTDPLDFEAAVEATLLAFRERFYVQQIFYDPYQLVAVAQRLTKAGLPMTEFPQTMANLTEASTNLYDLVKAGNLVVYPDAALRLAVHRTIAVETSRGWRIAKAKASHKIDVVVALAQAALGAVKQQHTGPGGLFELMRRQYEKLHPGADV